MDILSSAGKKVFEPKATGRTISALSVISGRDCLQSWGHIQYFWSWHPSLGWAAFLEWVASMLIGERHWELFWLIFGWIGWRCIIILGVETWLFVITLPSAGIQTVVFEVHLRIQLQFLWRDSYVSWGLAVCQLTHSHTMKHLSLVGANFA